MEWVKINWLHNHKGEPYKICFELDQKRENLRKVEYFKDNLIGFAFNSTEVNGTRLNLEVFPEIDEYNKLNVEVALKYDEELMAKKINKEEFEQCWKEALSANSYDSL